MLLLVVINAAYARSLLGPLQESIHSAQGISDNAMALLQGAALAFPIVVAAVPIGILIDRVSRTRLLIAFSILLFAGSFGSAFASSYELLFGARCVVGFAVAAMYATAMSFGADISPPHRRGLLTMLIGMAQMGGVSLAFAAGGYFIERFSGQRESWRAALEALSLPLLASAALPLLLREPERTSTDDLQENQRPAAIADLMAYAKLLAPLLIGMMFAEMSLGAAFVWIAPALERAFPVGPAEIGSIVATALLISGLVGPVIGGPLADLSHKAGGARRTALVVSIVVPAAAIPALFPFAPNLTSAAVLLVAFMVVNSAASVMGTTLFTVAIPVRVRGLAIALLFAATTLFGVGLAPSAASALATALGGANALGHGLSFFAIGCCLCSAIAFFVAHLGLPVEQK